MRNEFARLTEALLVLCGLVTASCGGAVTSDGMDVGEAAPARPDDPQAGRGDEEDEQAGSGSGASVAPWSLGAGSHGWQETKAVAVNADGNLALAGRFNGLLDLGKGLLPSSPDGLDAFVAKLDARGNAIWSRSLGGHEAEALAVAMDKDGSVVVTGYFYGTIDAGFGPQTSAGDDDIFVAKFDADGSPLWSRHFGGLMKQGATDIAVDAAGNVVLTGYDWAGIDFGGGPLGGDYGTRAFVVKLDAWGNHIWSRRFKGLGSADSLGKGVALDGQGNVVVTGMAQGSVDFGGGPAPSTGGEDMFVAKLDAAGAHLWSKLLGGPGVWGAQRVAVDSADNVVVFGSFNGAVDLGGGLQPAKGNQDAFLLKCDPNGGYLWSQTFGRAPYGLASAHGIAIDGDDNLLLTGSFTGEIDFGLGPLVNAGADDIFVAKLHSSGKALASHSYGGSEHQVAWGIGVDATGAAVISGYFMNTLDFGYGLLGAIEADIFIARLTP